MVSLPCPPNHFKWSLVRRLERLLDSIHTDGEVSALAQILVNKRFALGTAKLDWLEVGHSTSQEGSKILCTAGCSVEGKN